MDISTLATSIWTYITPLLPTLTTRGTDGTANEIWQTIRSRLAEKPVTQRVTERLLQNPENPQAQGAFLSHLEEALETDESFAVVLARLLEDAQKTDTFAASVSGSSAAALGSNSRAVAAQGIMAQDISGIINFGTMNLTQAPVRSAKKSTLPTQSYFFGRAKELETIARALSPETRSWGALIDGPGGIGKTALAIRAAHLAPVELFKRKILITAKVRELTPAGERPLTDFTRPSYLEMLNELGKELDEESVSRLAPDERANALRLALTGAQALIVFDNLETLPEAERVRLFQFLERLPEGNKAIVTSRRRSDVDVRVVRLDRLSYDEAMELIAELAKRYNLLDRASQKERDDLYAFTHGHPLFIEWLAGQLGRSGSHCHTIAEACVFLEKVPPDNDPLEYIFGDLLATFTSNETKVLAALTHFQMPAKLVWLAQISSLAVAVAETALEDLSDRSILMADLEARSFYLSPLTAQFIRTRRPKVVAKTGDTLCDRAYDLAMQYGGYYNYDGLKTLESEWPLLAAALQRFVLGNNARLQTVCTQLDTFLNFFGHWDEWLWFLDAVEKRALSANDRHSAGWRAFMAGWAYCLRSQPVDVLACAARATLHWQDSSVREKAFAIRLRGIGYHLKKDYSAALSAYRVALEIWRSISPESQEVASVLNDLAILEKNNKDYLAAERDYHEALRIARKANYQASIAAYTSGLADLALDRQQWPEAEHLAREALVLSESVGRQQLVASNCQRVGQALLKQNRALGEAETLARRAVEIFSFLRTPDRLESAQQTLTEIEAQLRSAAS